MTTFSLAISHTPWVPERVATLAALEKQLDVTNAFVVRAFEKFTDRAPNWEWSEKMWAWSVAQDVDWCVFLQDDAIVAPEFWSRLVSLISFAPRTEDMRVIGLQVAHPHAPLLALEG